MSLRTAATCALLPATGPAVAQPPRPFVLKIEAAPGQAGARVVGVKDGGINVPARFLQRFGWLTNGKVLKLQLRSVESLEIGDEIVSVTGRPTPTPAALADELARDGDEVGAAVLTVKDKNTGNLTSTLVHPAPGFIPGKTAGLPYLVTLPPPAGAPAPALAPVKPTIAHRLLADLATANDTAVVKAINPDGPAAQMHRFAWSSIGGNRVQIVLTAVGRLDKGDVIERVNGVSVDSAQAAERAVDEAGRELGAAILDVRDVTTGQVGRWVVHPSPTERRQEDGQRAKRNDRVKLLVVADDADLALGDGFLHSAELMLDLWTRVPGVDPNVDVQVLTTRGQQVGPYPTFRTQFAAADVQAAVGRLNVGRNDALVCCVMAHGAHDVNIIDYCKGHFFDSQTDLPRADLRRELDGGQAALTVLLSDSCNQIAKPALPRFTTAAVPQGAVLLDHLLRDYRGVVDVNASDQGESAWYAPNRDGGPRMGLFSTALYDACDAGKLSNW